MWQVTRGSDVKVTGDLKVGGTVTINCSQTDAQKKEGPGSELRWENMREAGSACPLLKQNRRLRDRLASGGW